MAQAKKKPQVKADHHETVERDGDYLQVISEGEFAIHIDGEFRGPYSPDVRRLVIRYGNKDKDVTVSYSKPIVIKQWSSSEDLDPTPIEVGLHRPPTLSELVQQMVRSEVSAQAEEEGSMSFEQFDNLGTLDEIEDDFPKTEFEVSDMQEDFQGFEESQESQAGNPQQEGAQSAPEDEKNPIKPEGQEGEKSPPPNNPT